MRDLPRLIVLISFTAASVTGPVLAAPCTFTGEPVPTNNVLDHAGARLVVASQLIELGYVGSEAAQMALQLTPADLVVLMDNPRMMQRAGAWNDNALNILIAVLAVGGLIALAAAGNGNVMQGGPPPV